MTDEAHDQEPILESANGEVYKSLREQILDYEDIEIRTVSVPEWGDLKIDMRTPTVEARGELISQFIDRGTGKIDYVLMYPSLVVATAYVPGTEERIFTMSDVEALKKKSAKALERLGAIAVSLSGLEDAEERVEVGKDASTPILNSLTNSD